MLLSIFIKKDIHMYCYYISRIFVNPVTTLPSTLLPNRLKPAAICRYIFYYLLWFQYSAIINYVRLNILWRTESIIPRNTTKFVIFKSSLLHYMSTLLLLFSVTEWTVTGLTKIGFHMRCSGIIAPSLTPLIFQKEFPMGIQLIKIWCHNNPCIT